MSNIDNDLAPLDAWCSGLIARLQPAERRRLTREIARRLRTSQATRIAAQLNPDGSAYAPRKPQTRKKKGAIRRKMFARIRTAKWLKVEATPTSAIITFAAGVQEMAKVHQYGLRDRVNRRRGSNGEPDVQYPERRLLGFTQIEVDGVSTVILDHLAGDAR